MERDSRKEKEKRT
jgi:hypothetical protein